MQDRLHPPVRLISVDVALFAIHNDDFVVWTPLAGLRQLIEKVLEEGYRTYDIMGEGKMKVGTRKMGDLIAEKIRG